MNFHQFSSICRCPPILIRFVKCLHPTRASSIFQQFVSICRHSSISRRPSIFNKFQTVVKFINSLQVSSVFINSSRFVEIHRFSSICRLPSILISFEVLSNASTLLRFYHFHQFSFRCFWLAFRLRLQPLSAVLL